LFKIYGTFTDSFIAFDDNIQLYGKEERHFSKSEIV